MKSIADLPVAILAGGLGTRLRPALKGVPKAMATVNGRPFLTYLFDWLIRQGARDVLLCTGYLGDQIRDCFSDRVGPLQISYSHEEEPLGTAGALRHCLPMIQSDLFLALNGDTFCDADLTEFMDWHHRGRFSASVLLSHQEDVNRFGSVETDPEGQIVQFHEKAARPGSGYVNAGIYLFASSVLETFPEDRALSMEYEVLPELIGKELSGYKTQSSFIDIGTPESLGEAQSYFKKPLFKRALADVALQSHCGLNPFNQKLI